MKIHLDPELRHEKLSKPAAVSLACHTALFLIVVLWGFIKPTPIILGDPDGDAGSAVQVNIADGIPIPTPRAPRNPVANPVEHEIPAPQEAERAAAPEPAPPEEPEAVPIEEPTRIEPKRQERQQAQKSAPEKQQNQVASSTGPQASSDVFAAKQTSVGGVGLQGRNPFGQGYAWYAEALQRALSAEWRKTLGQVSGKSGNPVVVRFTIAADGRIGDIRVVDSSGNRSLDYSAHRAVQYINPFKRLPPGLRRSSILVEMSFSLE